MYATTVNSGGIQCIDSGGVAVGTTINAGMLQINSKGLAKTTTIKKGGSLILNKGAKASAITLQASGSLVISSGGTANMKSIANGAKLTLKKGGTLNLTDSNVLYGKNSFTGATVTGGSLDKRVTLNSKATLTVGANMNMKKLHLDTSDATLSLTGTGNSLGSLLTNKNTCIKYDVSKLSPVTAVMLTLSSKNTQKLGSFSVNVKHDQSLGTYELSKNIVQKNISILVDASLTIYDPSEMKVFMGNSLAISL